MDIETRKSMNIHVYSIFSVFNLPNWFVKSRKNGTFYLSRSNPKRPSWVSSFSDYTCFCTKEEAEQCLYQWMRENLTEEEFDFEFASYIANKLKGD